MSKAQQEFIKEAKSANAFAAVPEENLALFFKVCEEEHKTRSLIAELREDARKNRRGLDTLKILQLAETRNNSHRDTMDRTARIIPYVKFDGIPMDKADAASFAIDTLQKKAEEAIRLYPQQQSRKL